MILNHHLNLGFSNKAVPIIYHKLFINRSLHRKIYVVKIIKKPNLIRDPVLIVN